MEAYRKSVIIEKMAEYHGGIPIHILHTGFPKTINATENNKATKISKQSWGVNTCLGTTCHGSN